MATLVTSCAPAPPVPTKPRCRYFYRCADCLYVAVTEVELKPVFDYTSKNASHVPHYATCEACGGEVQYIGKAYRQHLLRTEFRCPCDERCTSAPGPNCSCSCGGENHGTGRIVEVVVHSEKLPSLRIPPEAVKVAEEYRAARTAVSEAWTARFGDLRKRKREGEYLSEREFRLHRDGEALRSTFVKARNGKTHKGRMKALAAVLQSIKNS